MRSGSARGEPTLADLVVLALLSERPMHGYEIWRELVRREVQDWAAISRAQVYYSIAKLLENSWIRPLAGRGRSAGPERQIVAVTAKGRTAASRALLRRGWATQRPPPPFLTWLSLSHLADHRTLEAGIARRREFLAHEVEKEKRTLREIRADVGPMIPIAELIVELAIRQFEIELRWLDRVEDRISKRI